MDLNWKQAKTIGPLRDGLTNKISNVQTFVKILCNNEFLCVRFICIEPNISKLIIIDKKDEEKRYKGLYSNFLYRREHWDYWRFKQLGWGDFVEIFLSSYNEKNDPYHNPYLQMVVNSKGEKIERYFNEYGICPRKEFNSGSIIKTMKKENKWIVDITIPFSVFVGTFPKHTFTGNFSREHPNDTNREKNFCWGGNGFEYVSVFPTYGSPRNPERWGKIIIK
jgi:hypothetical protein